MSKIFQAFLSGLFFTFLLDFLLFLGIFLNYIQFLEIDLYYNILFADNQNIIIFLVFTSIIGYLITYVKNISITFGTILFMFILTSSSLIPKVGYEIGKALLMKTNVTYKEVRYSFTGDAYYNGRKDITFFDYELKKVIILHKKDLIK